MPENVYDEPLELLHFVSQEHEQFLIAIANERDELRAVNNLQGFYKAALSYIKLTDKADLVVYRLLQFTHYHFLFATACLLRCHLSEAFSSLRSAIDGAVVAAYIINDRPSQEAYRARQRPFDKLIRHARNFIRENRLDKLPHPQIPYLIEMHDLCSTFASHADINSFAHRAREFRDEHGIDWAMTEYFQFSRNPQQQRYYFFSLMQGFAIILDVFGSFLIDEQKKVGEQWGMELHRAIADFEKVREATGPPEEI